ncbi:MAG TPA: sensor histidine kinase [Symbiobacteriaceae bacterium]|nr:sensor histidine kinase [Symbiobacteriaceae bacterium]
MHRRGGNALQSIIEANRPLIYFAYGLVFFLTGWTIWFQHRQASSLRLDRSLPFLAAFGVLHGFGEWGHVFIPIQSQFVGPGMIQALNVIHQFLFSASFLALFLFGSYLMSDSRERLSWLPVLPLVLFGYWCARFLLYEAAMAPMDDLAWAHYSEAWGRYLLAFPGALTSAVGLHMQVRQFREAGFPRLVPDLRGASVAMAGYSVFAGLLVPQAGFFPANILNRELLLQMGMPVPIPRMVCSAFIAFFMLRTLRVFNAEMQSRLENAEAVRAAAEERDRLGRELHDGILQSIYAAGLGLQAVRRRMSADPEEAGRRVDLTLERLGKIIDEIRAYISDLDGRRLPCGGLRDSIAQRVTDFQNTYGIAVDWTVEGLPSDLVDQELTEQMVGILREALSNAGRHSRAHTVRVLVREQDNHISLTVADDGKGFEVSEALTREGHYGLRILYRRAQMAGGEIRILSQPGQGTQVQAILPRKRGA